MNSVTIEYTEEEIKVMVAEMLVGKLLRSMPPGIEKVIIHKATELAAQRFYEQMMAKEISKA